jgi:hypothetical protein
MVLVLALLIHLLLISPVLVLALHRPFVKHPL